MHCAVFVSRDENRVVLRSVGHRVFLFFLWRCLGESYVKCSRWVTAISGSFHGSGAGSVRSCARLLGLGHAVEHKVIFHSGRRRHKPRTTGMSAYVKSTCEQSDSIRIYTSASLPGNTILVAGLRLSAEWALHRGKGTETFKGNHFAPQRSHYDICMSTFSCDTFSLQLVLNRDNSPS